jgi:hypothetical protein
MDDQALFTKAGVGRGSNDSLNKRREEILITLYHSEEPTLQSVREKWILFLRTLCSEEFDDVRIEKRGGRGASFDFVIVFLRNGISIKTIRAEFKHNVGRIDKLPQYFSPAADKIYMPRLYADMFYDYLDEICSIYPDVSSVKPDREMYLRLVHNNDYERHPFFKGLHTLETTGTKEQYQRKKTVVARSIREFLTMYADKLNLEELSKDIRERQTDKLFVMWNLSEFKSDIIRPDEMELTHVERVKNGNTIVVVSKCGTKHNMLLRWKNHLGILYPAWQISLTR